MTDGNIYSAVGLGIEISFVHAVGQAVETYLRKPAVDDGGCAGDNAGQTNIDHHGMCVDTGEHCINYVNAEVMHLRLGHPSKEVTRRMGYPFPTKPCKWCLMKKSRNAASPTTPIPKGRARLDRVHVDIKISDKPDRYGRTRMLGLVDTFSNDS